MIEITLCVSLESKASLALTVSLESLASLVVLGQYTALLPTYLTGFVHTPGKSGVFRRVLMVDLFRFPKEADKGILSIHTGKTTSGGFVNGLVGRTGFGALDPLLKVKRFLIGHPGSMSNIWCGSGGSGGPMLGATTWGGGAKGGGIHRVGGVFCRSTSITSLRGCMFCCCTCCGGGAGGCMASYQVWGRQVTLILGSPVFGTACL